LPSQRPEEEYVTQPEHGSWGRGQNCTAAESPLLWRVSKRCQSPPSGLVWPIALFTIAFALEVPECFAPCII
jgi:hypothetical protein